MHNHAARQLNFWRRLLLATAGVVAIAGPIAVGALNARPLDTQTSTTDAGKLVFAEASVKPTSDSRTYGLTIGPDGRFAWKSVTLGLLVRRAYRFPGWNVPSAIINASQPIVGAPSWFSSDHFEIEARAEGNPTEEQIWAMVRSLMADRFKLKVHNETRDLPVYALVPARSDGTLGARIRPSACVAKDRVLPVPCGGVRTTFGTIQARFATMAKLADALGMLVGRPVQDRTGLTGEFDLEAEWTPASERSRPAAPGVGPATFAAIEEQLGLRLDPQTRPVDVLIIDHVERPAPDKAP